MKKIIIPILFGLFVFALPFNLLAKTVCYGDQFGNQYYLSGGKFDIKPFSGNIRFSAGCNAPIYGALVTDNGGTTKMSINVVHTSCNGSFWISASGTQVVATGHYDNGQNGSVDGPMTLTQINCSSIPPAITSKNAVNKGPGAK